MVWNIDPENRVVIVRRLNGTVTRLVESEMLDGEDVFARFCCPIGELSPRHPMSEFDAFVLTSAIVGAWFSLSPRIALAWVRGVHLCGSLVQRKMDWSRPLRSAGSSDRSLMGC